MNWPTSQDYNEAIQNAASSFTDPGLKGGEATVNAIGLPVPRSGNFADVYQFKGGDGKMWAVKCFTRKVAGLQERYAKIDEHLQKAKLPFTVGFKYFEEGIRVRGHWFPLLKMEWVEGFTLNEFVRNNAGTPKYLHALMQMWAKLTMRLRDANFAHADLQHGNVLLVPGDSQGKLGLKLIDYDGMWVPALADTHSGEIGHPNFQHPLRLKDRLYNAEVDRFPHLVIAAALRATLLGGKALWDQFDNGDNLLFKEGDLRDPAKAAVFKTLWNLHDDVLCVLVGKIALASQEPLRRTPWLDDLLLTEEGKKLRDDEEAKVVAMLGVAPHFTAVKAVDAPAPVQNEFNVFAFDDDDTAASPAKAATKKASPAKDDKKPKKNEVLGKAKSKLPLYIGAGVAAVVLLVVGIIVGTSGGKKGTPSPQEVAKIEEKSPQREQAKTKNNTIVIPPKKDNLVEAKKDEPPTKKDEPLTKKDEPSAKKDTEVVVKKDMQIPTVGAPALLSAPFTKEQGELARADWAKFLNVPERKELDLGEGVMLELVLIPPGEFVMGDKKNQRTMTISKPFYMAVKETTQEQFTAVMGSNPSEFSATGNGKASVAGLDTAKFPLERVLWSETLEFASKLKAQVPTEAQWEYACRAGTTTVFHFGDSLNGTEANCKGTKPYGTTTEGPFLQRTTKVASYAPNAFGLYDMHGNVREWCHRYELKTANPPEMDPEQPLEQFANNPIFRGGAWHIDAEQCRSISRDGYDPTVRLRFTGFRIIIPLADAPSTVTKTPDPPRTVEPKGGSPEPLKSPFTKEQAEKARAEWSKFLKSPERKQLTLGKGVKLELVLIPPGEFMMGEGNKQRRVLISKPMYMAATETTQEQYFAVIGTNPSGFFGSGIKEKNLGNDTSKFPVNKVNWDDAVDFCKKIKAQLPTDAQWEYACRAGTTTKYFFGDEPTEKDGNFIKGQAGSPKVASYPPNAFGLYDVHGSVWEWCRDTFSPNIGDLPEIDPERSDMPNEERRVIRGGDSAEESRSGHRANNVRTSRSLYYGFRVMVPLPPLAPEVVSKVPKEVGTVVEKMLSALNAKGQAELTIEGARFLTVKDGLDDKKQKIVAEPPLWLAERTLHFKSNQAGYTQFNIEKNGVVMMAVSPNFQGGGNASGGWKPECVSRQEFLAAGWHEAGTLRIRGSDWPLYWRECKKGESFKYRTEKYAAPIVFK